MLEQWHIDLMEELRVARLATISEDGGPNMVPVCFALMGEDIAIAVDEKPKRSIRLARLVNIERDPRVTFMADRYDDDWRLLAWVRVHGTAEIYEQGDEWPEALAELRTRYHQYETMDLEHLPLIRISFVRVAAWRWTETGADSNSGV
jgi:PPOX class probable F420-dependent enzyme